MERASPAITAWLCGLLALPGFAGQPKRIADPIVLYAKFEHGPPKVVAAALQDKLGSILSPLGLRVEWRDIAGRDDKPAVELAVVSFQGWCDMDRLAPPGRSPGVLGWTHISNGVILHFSGVDCDGIRALLWRALRPLSTAERQRAFGRALARVLAHELYHIFANTTRHSSSGVGETAYSVHDLLAATFRFGGEESQALTNSQAYQFLEKGQDPPH